MRAARGLGVIPVQLVAEPDIIDERGGAHFQVDVADDSSVSLPTRIDAERQLIFTGAARIGCKVRDRHLDCIVALREARAIEFVGYVGAHGSATPFGGFRCGTAT